ncbi:MAG: hypothetical protein ACJ8EB_12045 [Allosphingosinicella sp.]
MRYPARLVRILLILACGFQAGACGARCCKALRTSFGYLQVDRRDVPAATKAGNAISRSARDILEISDVQILIVDKRHTKYRWGDSTPSGLPVYPWSFAHGTVDLRKNPPDDILPHEIGHDLFRRYVVPETVAGEYGTAAPDWLDESVAVAFEAPEQKAGRRCEASRLSTSGALFPVHRFLTMAHPDSAAAPAPQAAGDARAFVRSTSVSQDTPAFYAMSIAFPEYLVARTGSTAILAELARASRTGVSLESRILSRVAGAGRQFDPEELNRDFLLWLASDKRYQCLGAN